MPFMAGVPSASNSKYPRTISWVSSLINKPFGGARVWQRAAALGSKTHAGEGAADWRWCSRPNGYGGKIAVDARGRGSGGKYFDANGREVFQRGRAGVVGAKGAETPRLLRMSRSNRCAKGLANTSGLVGRNLMFNGSAFAGGVFEHEVNGYKGNVVSRVIQDFY